VLFGLKAQMLVVGEKSKAWLQNKKITKN